jgi:hypothetical protein
MSKDWALTLDAGTAHGITTNACFDVYVAPREKAGSIGSLRAVESTACSSSMQRLTNSGLVLFCTSHAWALQTLVGDAPDVSVAVQLDDSLIDVFDRAARELAVPTPSHAVQLVEMDHPHELALTHHAGHVYFALADPLWRAQGLTRMAYSVPATGAAVYPILQYAADFFRLLRRSGRSGPDLARDVKVRMYALTPRAVPADTGGEFQGVDLVYERTEASHVNIAGVAVVPVEGETSCMYGFRLTSCHDTPLYAWVFTFDLEDLSIRAFFYKHSSTCRNAKLTVRLQD